MSKPLPPSNAQRQVSPTDMLKRIFAVADIIAKQETRHVNNSTQTPPVEKPEMQKSV